MFLGNYNYGFIYKPPINNNRNNNMCFDSMSTLERYRRSLEQQSAGDTINLDEKQSKFTQEHFKDQLESIQDSIKYYTRDLARSGKLLSEFMEQETNLQNILAQFKKKA